ncbi:hypothetical protein CVT24_004274 [Panaeolus cyanescens]|uniref:Uncharacterized protein n=1 Tax=Panaeolus cyanescens TaxID=181874 RepID=A0A409VDD3_9AGAR|nr:hypothetical protein CVT24_004274 [Panaeolus cyanescens]
MIILDDADAASVHTLVQPHSSPDPNTNVTVNPEPRIPRFVSRLTFASFGFSIPPLVLVLLNITLTRLHTVPTIAAFAFGMHFHIGNLIGLLRYLSCRPLSINPKLTLKVNQPAHITFLISVWTFATIMSALALIGPGDVLSKICSPRHRLSPTCVGEARITLIVSTVFSFIEVILLATILLMLSTWNYRNPQAAPRMPMSELNFWKYPLILSSLVFTLPSFIIALLNINIPSSITFSVVAIVAYVLTTPLHVGTIIMWRVSRSTPSVPFEPLARKRCASSIIFVLSLWLLTTIMSGRLATDPKLVEHVCGKSPSPDPNCEARAHIYFTASTIATALEVLILGVLAGISITTVIQKPKKEPSSSSPVNSTATWKGQTTTTREGA